jgi:hypothetical protein
MNCYDCATQDHLARPAVGVCHDCGAAVCDHHAVTRSHHLTRTELVNRVVVVEPAARMLRCTTCDAAYAAAHRPAARAEPRPARTRRRASHAVTAERKAP